MRGRKIANFSHCASLGSKIPTCPFHFRRGSMNYRENHLESEPSTDQESTEEPTSPTEKIEMEIDIAFNIDKMNPNVASSSTFLQPKDPFFHRKGSRKISLKRKGDSNPYSKRKSNFRKYRQDSLNKGT